MSAAEAWGASERAPDVIGTLRVYRYLKLAPDGQLHSLAFETVWRVKGPMTAECMRTTYPRWAGHTAPDKDCRCGFYAFYLPGVPSYIRGRYCAGSYWGNHVIAVAEASGTIIPNSLGVRAQKMTLLACAVADSMYFRGGNSPGIPLFPTEEAMVREYPPRDDISGITGRTPEVMRDEWAERHRKSPWMR